MNKKTMKKSLLVLAVTAIMLFAMSITSMAAGTKVTGLKQTKGSESSVTFTWNADPTAWGYYIYLSKDGGKTYARKYDSKYPDTYQAEGYFGSLQAGQKYYVKVATVYGNSSNCVTGPLSDAISAVTAPKQVDRTTIKQTKATTSSVSLKWTYSAGASGYLVAAGDKVVTVGGTSATVKMKAGNYSLAKVQAYKQSNEGFRAYSYVSTASDYVYTAPTTPKYVANPKKGNLKWFLPDGYNVTVRWNMASGYGSTVSGYQVQIYSIDGKKRLKTYTIKDKYTMSKEFNLKAIRNTGFKVRVRAYKTINGKNYFGNWSKFRAVVPQAKLNKNYRRMSKTSAKVQWTKVKNVTKYYIYVCKNTSVSQKDQVWKKVATVGKNTTSYTAKNLKPGKYNGIYVIPVVKAGGKTYKADATWYSDFWMPSYYY